MEQASRVTTNLTEAYYKVIFREVNGVAFKHWLFLLGYYCYQRASNMSSASCIVKCTFPENLCFKDIKMEDNKAATVQGCISADECLGNENNHLECCAGDLCNKGGINKWNTQLHEKA